MNENKFRALNSFARNYLREDYTETFQGDNSYSANRLLDSLTIAGCDVTKRAVVMKVVEDWYLLFKTEFISSLNVLMNAKNTMITFYRSVPTEYVFSNLTVEKALELGFCYCEEADAYAIPVWYMPLVNEGVALYNYNGEFVKHKELEDDKVENRGSYFPFFVKF